MPKSTCFVDGCGRHVWCRQLCQMHYMRRRRTGETGGAESLKVPRGAECVVDGCSSGVSARGLCSAHYQRLRLHGDVTHHARRVGKDSDARRKSQRRFSKTPKGQLKASRRRALMRSADVRKVVSGDWSGLVRQYRGCCAYCGASDRSLTREHIIPLARGGRHAIGNLLPVCGPCNSSKADRLLVEWRVSKKHSIAA